MTALFDTNILVDYLAGVDAARRELDLYGKRLVSAITWMEVMVGARGDAEEDVIEMFLRDFTLVPISRPVAREAIAVRRARRLRLPDAIIWASARTESALLVTRNVKDFPRTDPGIRVPY
ncbi:MAG: PIN domain-containing protein [Vicinamibacterales bacterium]